MNNFEHDIIRPNDKNICYFLWSDYFHDSVITDFQYCGNDIVIVMLCAREQEELYNTIHGTHEEKIALCKQAGQKHFYRVIFKKYKFFNHECGNYGNVIEYINGRFKRSALSQQIEKTTGKPHYHFRIQTQSGYIDIVCENIQIKKVSGSVRMIKNLEYIDSIKMWLDNNNLVDNKGIVRLKQILEIAQSEDDMERYFALTYLARSKHEQALYFARQCIQATEDTDSIIPSIWAMGEFGDQNDIIILMQKYLNSETIFSNNSICRGSTLLQKRNILDAIEKINFRLTENEVDKRRGVGQK